MSLMGGKSWVNLKQSVSRPVWLWDHFPASLALALFSDVSFTGMAGRQSWDAQLSEGWFANLAFEISLEIMARERCELSAEGSLPAGFGDPPTHALEAPALSDGLQSGSIMAPLRVLRGRTEYLPFAAVLTSVLFGLLPPLLTIPVS